MLMSFKKRVRNGFTLVELLAVIGVIAILAAILIPTIGSVIQRGHQVKCVSNLRQIGSFLQLYMNENKHYFPKPNEWNYDGWIEELSEHFDGIDPSLFACPSDDMKRSVVGDKRSYAVNEYLCRNDGFVQNDENPSMLVMLGERSTTVGVIGVSGANNLYGVYNLSALHDGETKSNVLFLDGHVDSMQLTYSTSHTPVWWDQRFKGVE